MIMFPWEVFANRLKSLMLPEKISVRHLSIQTNIPRKSISLYLQSFCLPRYDSLAKIADYFEVSCDYLLGLENECFYCYKTICKIPEIQANFVNKLITCMKSNQYSQSQLAEKLNMQQASVSKWIKMKTMPETPVIADIAKVFSYSVDFLLSRERIINKT